MTNRPKHDWRKACRGDTLVEVIITLFVLSLGSMAATSLVLNAIHSNTMNKNNLIALNLAVEGIEAVRNIRDNNWLKFSFNKEDCWNMRPEAETNDSCIDASMIDEGNYTVDLDLETMGWELSPLYSGETLDLNHYYSYMERFNLAFVNLNNGGSERDLFLSSPIIPPDPAVQNGNSPYYRMVRIDYGSALPADAAEMYVRSVVEWREGQGVRHVELNTVLTNYNRVKVNP